MRTLRFNNANIKYMNKGIVITGKCDDDRAVYVSVANIKSVEFNKQLLDDNVCGFQNESITIITKHNEYYELENKSNILAGILKELLAFINN
jgi:hypothetical protein